MRNADESAGEPWRWEDARWRGHVARVCAGQCLTPAVWPGGAKAAVALSFDSDHETNALRDGEISPGRLAQGEFSARVGVRRIMALLAEFNVPVTFFILWRDPVIPDFLPCH